MGTPSLQAKGTPRGVPFACYLGVGPGLGVPATAVGAAPAAAATVVRIGRGGHVAVVAATGPVVAAGRVAVVGTVVTGSPRAVGGVVAAAGAVAVGVVPTAGAIVAARAVAIADGVAVATGVDAADRAVGALRAVAVGIVADVVVDELITAVVLAQLDRVKRPAAAVGSADGLADRGSHTARSHEAREHEHNESSSSDSHDDYLLVRGLPCELSFPRGGERSVSRR